MIIMKVSRTQRPGPRLARERSDRQVGPCRVTSAIFAKPVCLAGVRHLHRDVLGAPFGLFRMSSVELQSCQAAPVRQFNHRPLVTDNTLGGCPSRVGELVQQPERPPTSAVLLRLLHQQRAGGERNQVWLIGDRGVACAVSAGWRSSGRGGRGRSHVPGRGEGRQSACSGPLPPPLRWHYFGC